jgi:hypothetical protein
MELKIFKQELAKLMAPGTQNVFKDFDPYKYQEDQRWMIQNHGFDLNDICRISEDNKNMGKYEYQKYLCKILNDRKGKNDYVSIGAHGYRGVVISNCTRTSVKRGQKVCVVAIEGGCDMWNNDDIFTGESWCGIAKDLLKNSHKEIFEFRFPAYVFSISEGEERAKMEKEYYALLDKIADLAWKEYTKMLQPRCWYG